MKRRNRIIFTVIVTVLSVALVISLIMLGSASEGPLRSLFDDIGGGLTRMEARAARGTGRIEELPWLEPYRTNPDSLRRPRHILLGAYDDRVPATLDGVLQLERTLGVPLPLVQLYCAWGDASDHEFPLRLVRAIDELGSIPVITWEPWLTT